MKTKISSIVMLLAAFFLMACQDNDYDRAGMILQAPDAASILGEQQGDNYVLTWPALGEGKQMQIAIYKNGTISSTEVCSANTYTQTNVPTNVPFEYVFKVTDGTNLSTGVIKKYTREGATAITGISMKQVDIMNGYNAEITWDAAADATNIYFTADNGQGRTISETLAADATSKVIEDVKDGEVWTVVLIATNEKGNSMAATSSLKIGKTTIGFLSIYSTPEELVNKGDDDEASAWLWLHEMYPTAKFVPFSSIKSAADVDPYRVLFWIRDIETGSEADVWEMPQVVMNATPVIKEWYKNGGSLLLWSHATPYIGTLGRLNTEMLKANDHTFGCTKGSYNPDIWRMAVELNPGGKFKVDMSSHPIYNGIEIDEKSNNRVKLVPVKGPGWAEDHNCLYFNIPSKLTGLENQDPACYDQLTDKYGIYPLGVWDSQIDWVSQMNIFEARQGDSEFKGTILCVGNGGCEFSMNNSDGTKNVTSMPLNNLYQDNILKMAENALEYLKTR